MKQYFKIVGSARYLPRKCIHAEELDRRSGLEAGWTLKHTGVRVRHEAGPDESGTEMARRVVMDALKSAGFGLRDLDLLIDASLCLQQPIPSNSALILESLGREAAGCATMDVHSSCLGFVAALQTVNGLFAAEGYDRAVIVCGETPLRGVNWDEPESAHLMGDGAAAIVLERCSPRDGCAFRFQTFAEGAQLCRVEGGCHRLPPAAYASSNRARYEFHMDGKGVHRFASQHLPAMVAEAVAASGTPLSDLHVVPHQASGPSIELLTRRLGIGRSRVHSSVEHHGNMVAAGIPFVLHGARAELAEGVRVMLVGTAAGYSQAVAIFTL